VDGEVGLRRIALVAALIVVAVLALQLLAFAVPGVASFFGGPPTMIVVLVVVTAVVLVVALRRGRP